MCVGEIGLAEQTTLGNRALARYTVSNSKGFCFWYFVLLPFDSVRFDENRTSDSISTHDRPFELLSGSLMWWEGRVNRMIYRLVRISIRVRPSHPDVLPSQLAADSRRSIRDWKKKKMLKMKKKKNKKKRYDLLRFRVRTGTRGRARYLFPALFKTQREIINLITRRFRARVITLFNNESFAREYN